MTSELSPGFLVAAPALLDPNFHRTVVLLVDHREEGSLGFVINRPAPVELPEVLDALGLKHDGAGAAPDAVLLGGPMAPETGWVLFEQGEKRMKSTEVVSVSDALGVTASREMLSKFVQVGAVKRFIVALGYAGWGPGQRDAEIAQGAWIPVDLDAKVVFDTPYPERWAAALALLGIDPARLTTVGTPGLS